MFKAKLVMVIVIFWFWLKMNSLDQLFDKVNRNLKFNLNLWHVNRKTVIRSIWANETDSLTMISRKLVECIIVNDINQSSMQLQLQNQSSVPSLIWTITLIDHSRLVEKYSMHTHHHNFGSVCSTRGYGSTMIFDTITRLTLAFNGWKTYFLTNTNTTITSKWWPCQRIFKKF